MTATIYQGHAFLTLPAEQIPLLPLRGQARFVVQYPCGLSFHASLELGILTHHRIIDDQIPRGIFQACR